MPNVQLGAHSAASDAIYWKKKADRMVSQYRASSLRTGRYAMLQGMENELNRYITSVGRPLLSKTVEGDALLRTYDSLARLEASERSIASKNVIAAAKSDAAKVQAKASQQAAKSRYEYAREKEGGFTARIDKGRDILDPLEESGLSMPIMLGLGGAALATAYFIFKG